MEGGRDGGERGGRDEVTCLSVAVIYFHTNIITLKHLIYLSAVVPHAIFESKRYFCHCSVYHASTLGMDNIIQVATLLV